MAADRLSFAWTLRRTPLFIDRFRCLVIILDVALLFDDVRTKSISAQAPFTSLGLNLRD